MEPAGRSLYNSPLSLNPEGGFSNSTGSLGQPTFYSPPLLIYCVNKLKFIGGEFLSQGENSLAFLRKSILLDFIECCNNRNACNNNCLEFTIEGGILEVNPYTRVGSNQNFDKRAKLPS